MKIMHNQVILDGKRKVVQKLEVIESMYRKWCERIEKGEVIDAALNIL